MPAHRIAHRQRLRVIEIQVASQFARRLVVADVAGRIEEPASGAILQRRREKPAGVCRGAVMQGKVTV